MASDVDCKQNQATCSKKNVTLSTNTVTQSIRHFNFIIFRGTRPI